MAHNPNKVLIQLTVLETIKMLGIKYPEISFTRAKSQFGGVFTHLVERGKITPCRYGNGPYGTRFYAVSDIITAIGEEEAKAKLL